MFAFTIPAFIPENKEVEAIRHDMRKTWLNAEGGPAPVIFLGMRDKDNKLEELKRDNIFVFQTGPHHHLIAHELMNEIVRRVKGLNRVFIGDDDFIVNNGINEFSAKYLNTTEKYLFAGSKRMWFTSMKHKSLYKDAKGEFQLWYVNENEKLFKVGTKLWDQYSYNYEDIGNVTWTRDGFLIDVDDMRKTVETRLEIFPQKMADRFMISGIDVLTLNRLIYQEGLHVERVTSHYHNTYREDDKTGSLNHSTCSKSYDGVDRDIIDTPMIQITRDRDLNKVLELWDQIPNLRVDVLQKNYDEFNRLNRWVNP